VEADARKSLTDLRLLSKLLFGNLDRLDVILAVGDSPDGLICAADLEHELGLANNRVRAQLKTLADAGFVDALPRGRGDRIQWYQRRSSALWTLCADLRNERSRSSRPS